jgi:hypothetical protein
VDAVGLIAAAGAGAVAAVHGAVAVAALAEEAHQDHGKY